MKKRPFKSNNRLVKPKKRRRSLDPVTLQLLLHLARGVGVFILLVIFLTVIWYGTRVSALTISTVTVVGGQTISHTVVQEAINQTLEGAYLGLIPKRFAWTYPEGAVLEAVGAISRVKDPVVERVSGTELQVTIDEYIPFALWCQEAHETECLFVDAAGIAFAPAPALDGGALYRFYTLGTVPTTFATMRSADELKQITELADAFESDFALPVTKIELDIVGDVFYRVVGGGEIKVSMKQSSVETLENLGLILTADEFKNIAPGTFKYIDLRFGSKVFVNDTQPTVATSTPKLGVGISETETADVPRLNAVIETVADEVVEMIESPVPSEVGDEGGATTSAIKPAPTAPATTTDAE